MWFAKQRHPRGFNDVLVARCAIDGDFPDALLELVWARLAGRHAVLRTRFDIADGRPIQIVDEHRPLSIAFHGLHALTAAVAAHEAERIAADESRTPFDLNESPLVRVSRITLSDSRSIVVIAAHRLICDEWSLGILLHEMGIIGSALQNGEEPQLVEAPTTYGRYCEAQRRRPANDPFEPDAAALYESLRRFKTSELLGDRPRSTTTIPRRTLAQRSIDAATARALGDIAYRHDCRIEAVAGAALLALLHRYSGETDIGIGVQLSTRESADVADVAGCFVAALPLRGDVSDDPPFLWLLERTSAALGQTFDLRHSHVGLPKDPPIDLRFERSRPQPTAYGRFALLELAPLFAGGHSDVSFRIVELADGWRLACECNADLYDAATAHALLEHFEILLRAIAAKSDTPISRLELLSKAERHELLVTANDTRADYPPERSAADLICAQAQRTPDAVAVTCGDRELTYAELDAAANRLARELTTRGLGAGARIGIFLERSANLVVALLAVLKAGSAYVPLDPEYPRERLTYIIEDSRVAAIVSDSHARDRLGRDDANILCLDRDASAIAANGSESLTVSVLPTDLAYIIYTSGSTGKPKGVQIKHRALVNLLCSVRQSPGITAADVLVAVTTISFDIAAVDMFLPLIAGARLVIAQKAEAVDGGELWRLLERHAATIMQATPITWQLLTESGWAGDPALKMLCTGEALSRKLADTLLACGGELWNMYGPTETTIWSSGLRVESRAGPVLLGPPIANTQLYVLDANRELLPAGAAGELYIGGDGVALGYFGRPDLTAERFVPDSFRDVPAATLYRTGDIVRRRAGNTMEFLGRSDQQIKLRGFRIELGEIEAALLAQPQVADAAVVVRHDEAGDKALWAFAVPAADVLDSADAFAATLRSGLSRSLPHYMIPAKIGVLPSLPRTPNRKLDRQALPQTIAICDSAHAAPPATAMEIELAAAIGGMLGRQTVGRHEDIFDLGFHSLLAVRLIRQIDRRLGVALPLHTIVEARTVERLAQSIVSLHSGPPADDAQPVVTLNAPGSRPPFIYFHSDILADGIYCRSVARAIPDQPIHAVAPHGTAGLAMMPNVEAMARDLLPLIRKVQPHGPYRLGGFCAGGVVAYEAARLLSAQGALVERLILINASAPLSHAPTFADRIIRAIGRNWRIAPLVRESSCYNVARLAEAIGMGPRGLRQLVAERLRALLMRIERKQLAEIEPFEMRRGSRETELHFAHLVAELTYHPQPFDGELTLVWGADQTLIPGDPTFGWSTLARTVRVVPMEGGHVSPLHDRTVELGNILGELLR